jgi:hypothetical protein
MSQNKKPPLGLMPQKIWIELRVIDITKAIARYIAAGKMKDINPEWINELAEHIDKARGW